MATAQSSPREREYETIYVLRPDVDPDAADRVANRITDVVARENGKLVKVENWGRRRLAYEMKKQKRGVYYYLKYLGRGALVSELERNLRMLDGVMKFQTVLLRSDVPIDGLEIDPEEVKFARLEPAVDEDKDESHERALGLIEAEAPPARGEGEYEEDEGDEWAESSRKGSELPPSADATGASSTGGKAGAGGTSGTSGNEEEEG